MDFFRFFDFDQLSFWFGFLTATLLWWLVLRIRPLLGPVRTQLQQGFTQLRLILTSQNEDRYRNDVLRYAQGQHMASMLFALDDILVEPGVYLPDRPPLPGTEILVEESALNVIPNLPRNPEIPAVIGYPSMSLAQALSQGANLLLSGPLGSGKSVALASLASQLARRAIPSEAVEDLIPVLVHVDDLAYPYVSDAVTKDPMHGIYFAASQHVSTIVASGLLRYLRANAQVGRLMILLDGVDALPDQRHQELQTFWRQLTTAYPKLRYVIAVDSEGWHGWQTQQVELVTIAGWHASQRTSLIERWESMWKLISPPAGEQVELRQALITNWLTLPNPLLSPLEMTLRIWSVLTGDVRGPLPLDNWLVHFQRLTIEDSKLPEAARRLAWQSLRQGETVIRPAEGSAWLRESALFAPPQVDPEAPPDKKTAAPQNPGAAAFAALTRTMLIERQRENWGFVHPLLTALAAALHVQENPQEDITSLAASPAARAALQFHAALTAQPEHIMGFVTAGDDPAGETLRRIAAQFRYMRNPAAWSTPALRRLAGALQNSNLPFVLRLDVLTGILHLRENGATALLKHLRSNPHPAVRRLAILGIAALEDTRLLHELSSAVGDASQTVRYTACLGLGAIDNKKALEELSGILVHADEDLRKAAAEALAMLPGEGHAVLKEGAFFEDILVRRAVVFGLRKINHPWSIKLLEEIQFKDGQWVVRTAAEQALQSLNTPHPCLPLPWEELRDQPWLIEFAAKRGQGIPSEEAAKEMLSIAAYQDDEDAGALARFNLIRLGILTDGLARATYNHLFGPDEETREQAYHILDRMVGNGNAQPDPVQFGFG